MNKEDETEFNDAKVRILREFYAQNQLAYAVAEGKDTYKARIEFIEEKYDTFGKKILMPKKDGAFDQEVIQVLGSINNVGEYGDGFGKPYINSKRFTTGGRKRDILRPDLSVLVVGGGMSLLMNKIAYEIPVSLGEPDVYSYALTGLLIAMLPLFYGMIKLIHGVNMNDDLNNLRTTAQKTDEFLRQNYVEK